MRKLILAGALALLASLGVAAQAQDLAPPVLTPDVGIGMAMLQAPMNQAQRQARQGRPAPSLDKSLRAQLVSPSRSAPAVASLSYRPSPAVRAKVVRIFLDNGPKNPAYVSEIKQFVQSGRVFREYAGVAPKFGFRVNDAVDAYAFYLLAQWGVANDHRPDFTRAQVAGVKAQAARALASVASALANDATRQEFAETLIAQGALMAAAHEYNATRGKEDVVRMLASKARQGGVRVFNMDPTRIALTNSGFRLRGNADAGGAGAGAGAETLASANVSGANAEGKSDADGGAAPVAVAAALVSGVGLWALNGKRRRSTETPASKL